MIAFRLDDFKEQPLREAGVQLGIPNAANMAKDDLIREIKARISPNSAIMFVPTATVAEPKAPDRVSRVISWLALFVSVASAFAAYWGVIATLNKNYADNEAKIKESWQAVTVYEIIERGTASDKAKWSGLTFDEIKSKYSEEISAAKNPLLGKEELQADALKKILVGMIETGLLYRTLDDRFIVQRAAVSPKETLVQQYSAPNSGRLILKLLGTESGKYTVDKLGAKMNAEHKIDAEEYWATINSLMAQRLISIDANEQVWSAVSSAKKK